MFSCIPDPNPNARGELVGPIKWDMCFMAVGIIVVGLLGYHLIAWLFSGKKDGTQT